MEEAFLAQHISQDILQDHISFWPPLIPISKVVSSFSSTSEIFASPEQPFYDHELPTQVASLLQDVTLSQLQFSQPFPRLAGSHDRVEELPECVTMKSNCHFEFDTLLSMVLNRTFPVKRFGFELWEEERLRCEKRGLPSPYELPPTPPWTDSILSGETEAHLVELEDKVRSLGAKGALLFTEAGCDSSSPEDLASGGTIGEWLTQHQSLMSKRATQDAIIVQNYLRGDVPTPIADVADEAVVKICRPGVDSEEEIEETDFSNEVEDIICSQREIEEESEGKGEVTKASPDTNAGRDSTPSHQRQIATSIPLENTIGFYSQVRNDNSINSQSLEAKKSYPSTAKEVSRKRVRFASMSLLSAFQRPRKLKFLHADRASVPLWESLSQEVDVLPPQPSSIDISMGVTLRSSLSPPSYKTVQLSKDRQQMYPSLFYSDETDRAQFSRQQTVPPSPCTLSSLVYKTLFESFQRPALQRRLTPAFLPPSRSSVGAPSRSETIQTFTAQPASKSQVETPLKTNASRLIASDQCRMNLSDAAKVGSRITVLSLEAFCCNRIGSLDQQLLPCAKNDAIQMVIWRVCSLEFSAENEKRTDETGILYAVQPPSPRGESVACTLPVNNKSYQGHLLDAGFLPSDTDYEIVNSERELFASLIAKVISIDPDILVGYEVQKAQSIGYLCRRAMEAFGLDLLCDLSRMPGEMASTRNEHDVYDEDHDSGIFITGRIVLNLWRLARHELTLRDYSLQNVALHLLNRRVPCFTAEQMTRWFKHPKQRCRVVRDLYRRTVLNMEILDKLDLLRRTAEFARMYGIDFYSVISRGSQYRVEAAMLGRAHSEGFVAISPSRSKVANQAPISALPSILEPPSSFYGDPMVVLDFQSLYPSMMIAYNICFSTIIGKVQMGGAQDTSGRLGVIDYPEQFTAALVHHHERMKASPILISNGSLFCSKDVRVGIIPQMAQELLDTRLMLKKAMKQHTDPSDAILRRVLDARQLAIKLLLNVTYGYTAASFSGRMPMAEVADAIVQRGRDTLRWSIHQVEHNVDWRARVLYGDTDSMFVYLPGRNKLEAFAIGKKIVEFITSKCPLYVVLKLEKVYLPCILQTMKRYVGSAFESARDTIPHFDAKGIEVVRRDQCAIVGKMQEQAIRILFETRDLSLVKAYLIEQWTKLAAGDLNLNVRDFVFAKEVKLDRYKAGGPPGAEVVRRMIALDPNAEPPYSWRVPYVVVTGNASGSSRLMDLVVPPQTLLQRGSGLTLNTKYYITKCINPALDRVFKLCGNASVKDWYAFVPRSNWRPRRVQYAPMTTKSGTGRRKAAVMTLERWFPNANCEFCSNLSRTPVCPSCAADKREVFEKVVSKLNKSTAAQNALELICYNCSKHPQHAQFLQHGALLGSECCSSLSCVIFHERYRQITKIEDLSHVLDSLSW